MSTNADDKWAKSPDSQYPTKQGVCEVCGHKDKLKLGFDLRQFICINAHACLLRWKAERAESLANKGV